MNFFMMIIFIFEAVVGIGSSVFILISLFWVMGKKLSENVVTIPPFMIN